MSLNRVATVKRKDLPIYVTKALKFNWRKRVERKIKTLYTKSSYSCALY